MKRLAINFLSSLFLSFLCSCLGSKNDTCAIDYPRSFGTDDPPVIHITGEVGDDRDGCVYGVDINIWFDGYHLSSKGELYEDSGAFFIKSMDPESGYFKYFDFLRRVGDNYKIPVDVNNRNYTVSAAVEKIIDLPEGSKVYMFRFRDTFRYEGKAYDTVIFASKEKGVLGSFFSSKYQNLEYMLVPSGNIFSEHIDYSKFEVRELK